MTNQDTFSCPKSVRIREVPLYTPLQKAQFRSILYIPLRGSVSVGWIDVEWSQDSNPVLSLFQSMVPVPYQIGREMHLIDAHSRETGNSMQHKHFVSNAIACDHTPPQHGSVHTFLR